MLIAVDIFLFTYLSLAQINGHVRASQELAQGID